jgi:hypothetical protein
LLAASALAGPSRESESGSTREKSQLAPALEGLGLRPEAQSDLVDRRLAREQMQHRLGALLPAAPTRAPASDLGRFLVCVRLDARRATCVR